MHENKYIYTFLIEEKKYIVKKYIVFLSFLLNSAKLMRFIIIIKYYIIIAF